MIETSNALPIQFYDADDESDNIKDVYGITKVCFCQPIVAGNDQFVQFKGEIFTAFSDPEPVNYSLRIIDSSDNTLETIPFLYYINTSHTRYVYYLSFTFQDYSITNEQVTIEIHNEDSPSLLKYTNCLSVKVSHPGTVDIAYRNNADFAGLSYPDSAFTPGFTPAILPPIGSWTNINDAGPAWNNSLGDPFADFNSLGLASTSDLYYTNYAFEEGREYSFDYAFEAAAGLKVRIKIFDAGGEISNTEIDVLGLVSGTYNYTAVSGAIGIGINAYQAASCGSGTPYFCAVLFRQFDNTTPTIPDSDIVPDVSFIFTIPAIFFEPDNSEEQEDIELSDETIVRLYNKLEEKILLDIGFMPHYMHRKLRMVLMHDSVIINTISCLRRDEYQKIEKNRHYPLYRAKVFLLDKNFIKENQL